MRSRCEKILQIKCNIMSKVNYHCAWWNWVIRILLHLLLTTCFLYLRSSALMKIIEVALLLLTDEFSWLIILNVLRRIRDYDKHSAAHTHTTYSLIHYFCYRIWHFPKRLSGFCLPLPGSVVSISMLVGVSVCAPHPFSTEGRSFNYHLNYLFALYTNKSAKLLIRVWFKWEIESRQGVSVSSFRHFEL